MDKYKNMTQEDFDRILRDIVNEEPASNLLLMVPNIYSDIAEHFNNEVLDR